jgi:serine/threonine protein kinase
MAELVVKSQCRSVPRQVLETALNVTFPLWGIVSPLLSVGIVLGSISMFQMGDVKSISEMITVSALFICSSLFCLLLKKKLAADYFVIDKVGVKLPHLLGNEVNLKTYIPWENIQNLSAIVSSDALEKSRISITQKKGNQVRIGTKNLEPQFIEQLVLAARMWAPSVCDASLENLQNELRIGMQNDSKASYTELWEEELGRRFSPSAYIGLEPGKVLRNNSLKVVSHLASGGLSALYLCQMDGKKLVVLKEAVVPESSAESVREKARELFEREAQLLMKLDNQSIVKILDCFVENGRNYMLLEHVSGTDLRQLVKQNGPQKESDVLEWAIQIAIALKYLHDREQPIIHRDLTPDNIVLRNDGQITIVDFGAANEFIGNATGTFVGKHSYIAPEQLRGKATAHSDIYAFGCTLFYLLSGKEPEALSPSILKEHGVTASDELSELIESCTQLEASDRYQSVAQMIPVLRRLAAQSIVV